MSAQHQQEEDVIRGRMHKLGWAGAFLGFVLAVTMGYSMWQASVRRDVEQLPVIRAVPEFALTDQNGDEVTMADLRGKIWIADFIFTRCAGPCPLMTARMLEMQKALVKTPEVKLVSVTVDPAYDTPEVLKAYAEANFADPNRWKFLTGEKEVIEKLVTEGFMQHLAEENGEPVHGTMFLLVDGQGMVRSARMLEDPELIPKVLMDTGNLLREQGQSSVN
ncbi:MAG: SCO family protein [Verrucomicrobia bacterium]|jgi:protein SCO1|nr:SCO family protein [Verrucomicrobiota bacterium]MDA1202840.1 SCO family protein [Verrucomicrobiota bacterium]